MMKELKDAKVLIGPSSFSADNNAALNRLREEGCEIIENPYKRRLTKEEVMVELL